MWSSTPLCIVHLKSPPPHLVLWCRSPLFSFIVEVPPSPSLSLVLCHRDWSWVSVGFHWLSTSAATTQDKSPFVKMSQQWFMRSKETKTFGAGKSAAKVGDGRFRKSRVPIIGSAGGRIATLSFTSSRNKKEEYMCCIWWIDARKHIFNAHLNRVASWHQK